MQLVLIDNSYLANLSLVTFKIHNKQILNLYCLFIFKYIDDILTITVLSIPKTTQLLVDFYKLLNLNLIPNQPKNNIIIYLNIQLYTPQTNNIPLSFRLYRKLILSFLYPKLFHTAHHT
jgi:hypothetical protein